MWWTIRNGAQQSSASYKTRDLSSIKAHDIVIHGSTHQQEMKTRGDTLIVNPGEACGWIHGTPRATAHATPMETKATPVKIAAARRR